jgi:hypothetical protein
MRPPIVPDASSTLTSHPFLANISADNLETPAPTIMTYPLNFSSKKTGLEKPWLKKIKPLNEAEQFFKNCLLFIIQKYLQDGNICHEEETKNAIKYCYLMAFANSSSCLYNSRTIFLKICEN